MTTSVKITPDQLAAIRSEVQAMLDVLRDTTEQKAADATDEYGRIDPYAAGRRDGVALAEVAVRKAFAHIARYGRADHAEGVDEHQAHDDDSGEGGASASLHG